MNDEIMGVEISEFKRQCAVNTLMCDSNSPISDFETLEPSIKGGRKIIANSESIDFFRKLYTRE